MLSIALAVQPLSALQACCRLQSEWTLTASQKSWRWPGMLPRQSRATDHFPTRGDSQALARSEAIQGSRWDEAMPVSARLLQIQNSRQRQQPLEAAGASSTRTSWLLASCGAAYVAAPAPRLRSTRRTTPAFAPALLDIAALPLATA